MSRQKIQRIVVNKHKVKANILHGTHEPVLSIQRSGETPEQGHEVDVVVDGKVIGTFIYRPGRPLGCGATVWFETRATLVSRRTPAPTKPARAPRPRACPVK